MGLLKSLFAGNGKKDRKKNENNTKRTGLTKNKKKSGAKKVRPFLELGEEEEEIWEEEEWDEEDD